MPSLRDRSKRLNQGVFISGASGSGKSRMTERLAEPWKRVIYVDPMRSFDVEAATTWDDAAKKLAQFWKSPEPMQFGVSFTDDEDYRKFFGALLFLMDRKAGTLPNFLFVLDEVDLWSSPQTMDPKLARILRYGRHYGCSWIANCRADVHTNRDVRMNAAEVLIFQQDMLSPDMEKKVKSAARTREAGFPEVQRLVRHGPDEPELAVEYIHFIAWPLPFDEWYPSWTALATDAK